VRDVGRWIRHGCCGYDARELQRLLLFSHGYIARRACGRGNCDCYDSQQTPRDAQGEASRNQGAGARRELHLSGDSGAKHCMAWTGGAGGWREPREGCDSVEFPYTDSLRNGAGIASLDFVHAHDTPAQALAGAGQLWGVPFLRFCAR